MPPKSKRIGPPFVLQLKNTGAVLEAAVKRFRRENKFCDIEIRNESFSGK